MATVPGSPAGDSGPDPPESGWTADQRHLDPDDPLLLARLGIVVPDDARALDDLRRDLLRPPRRLRGARRPHPQLAALVVTFLLLGATVLLTGSLVAVMSPDTAPSARSAYALADPIGLPGEVGGLLPDAGATLEDGTGVSARDLRPAVLVLPPASTDATNTTDAPCATCAATTDALHRQAQEYGIDTYLVTTTDGAAAARALLAETDAATADLLVDPSGALTAAFAGPATTAVLVHADGLVGRILRDPAPTARFEQFLSPLRLPGAPTSLQSVTSTQ